MDLIFLSMEEREIGLKWYLDHMEKAFFLNEKNIIQEVFPVVENGKICTNKIKIDNTIFFLDDFKNYFEYNTSFDDIQLPLNSNERDEKMSSILYELADIKYIDSGYYKKWTNKTGEERVKFYERKSSLEGTFFFYHNNTDDHPHFHLYLKKDIPLGKDCLKLRAELNKVFSKHNIIPNCEIVVESNNTPEGKYKIREFQFYRGILEKISWLYKQAESEVTNPNMSASEFLATKKILVDGIEVYVSNRCYFTIQKESSFKMEVVINKGKENERKDMKTVHALNEIIDKYSEFSEVAGSKKYLAEIINRIEKIEGIVIDKNYIERYETIDNLKPIDTLKNLITKIHYGKKISSEYKDIWRNNILSKDKEKKLFAEAIAKIYQFRHNKLFSYNKKELEAVYLEYKEKIEKIGTFELKENKMEKIKSELNKLVEIFENVNFVSKEELIDAMSEEGDIIQIINSDIEFESLNGSSYMILPDKRIDLSKYIKEYGAKKDYKFKTLEDIMTYNKYKKMVKEFENEITNNHKELKDTLIEFTNKIVIKEKEGEIISNLINMSTVDIKDKFLDIINTQKVIIEKVNIFHKNLEMEDVVTEFSYDDIRDLIFKSYEKIIDVSRADVYYLDKKIEAAIFEYEAEIDDNIPEVYSYSYDYTEPFSESYINYCKQKEKISYSEETHSEKIDDIVGESSEDELLDEECEEESDIYIDNFFSEYKEK